MFGCTSQTQCMFVGKQANLNAGHGRCQINKAQLQSPKAMRDRESMEIVKTNEPFFSSWKIIQSFSFPIQC